MAVSINGNVNADVVYGKGDVCLKLNPFDCYRMFTLYDNWKNDDRKPLDLSGGQRMFLVFKSKNHEIRIPECDLSTSGYNVDKVNGQVLFKINQKQAVDILALPTRVFYITRLYEMTDMTGDRVISSDEEVVYTGQWKDESDNTVEEYTAQIKKLMDMLEERNNEIRLLQESNASLIEQNVNMAAELEDLRKINDTLTSELNDMETRLNEYESGSVYDGMVVGGATHHTIISNKEYTEEQLANVIRELESQSFE